jgi:hypothetical protein
VINRYKVAKHFDIIISDHDVSFTRNAEQINAEAALDGIYVVRTGVNSEALDASSTVKAYKQLSNAVRAFRSLKTIDIEVRPIHHRHPNRVRAHVFLCMLFEPFIRGNVWHVDKVVAAPSQIMTLARLASSSVTRVQPLLRRSRTSTSMCPGLLREAHSFGFRIPRFHE